MAVADSLKTKTQLAHEETETLMQSHKIMAGNLTLADYKGIVATLYNFHFHFEKGVQEQAQAIFGASLDLSLRRKLPALTSDALALHLPPPQDYAQIDISPWQALGWTYVMEGASLGGQVILRKISAIPEIAATEAYRYYEGYGAQTGAYWLAFKNALNASTPVEHEAEVTEGALHAFKTLGGIAGQYFS